MKSGQSCRSEFNIDLSFSAQAEIPFVSDAQAALGSRFRGNDGHLFFEIGFMQSPCSPPTVLLPFLSLSAVATRDSRHDAR